MRDAAWVTANPLNSALVGREIENLGYLQRLTPDCRSDPSSGTNGVGWLLSVRDSHSRFILGVQAHPEDLADKESEAKSLFAAFVASARQYQLG